MRIVIQRVIKALVEVEQQIVGEIQQGLLVLCGFEPTDTEEDFLWIIKKIIQLRIFDDEHGIMNYSVQDVNGKLLIVSQFTLQAVTKKGNRPSYIKASKPEIAKQQYDTFCSLLEQSFNNKIEKGIFGAMMQVQLINDGPVTIFIDSKNKE